MIRPVLIGEASENLTLLEVLTRRVDRRLAALYLCRCGTTKALPVGRVRGGYILSCGCMGQLGVPPKHGMKGSPEYSTWGAIKSRCFNTAAKDYRRYGALGVTMCPEWAESFEAFYAHIGPRPPGTSVDRIDTTKGYVPGNVRWATPTEQAENTLASWRVIIERVEYPSVQAAARAHGVSDTTIMRWCDGFRDPRRGTEHGPKPGCYRLRRYPRKPPF